MGPEPHTAGPGSRQCPRYADWTSWLRVAQMSRAQAGCLRADLPGTLSSALPDGPWRLRHSGLNRGLGNDTGSRTDLPPCRLARNGRVRGVRARRPAGRRSQRPLRDLRAAIYWARHSPRLGEATCGFREASEAAFDSCHLRCRRGLFLAGPPVSEPTSVCRLLSLSTSGVVFSPLGRRYRYGPSMASPY